MLDHHTLNLIWEHRDNFLDVSVSSVACAEDGKVAYAWRDGRITVYDWRVVSHYCRVSPLHIAPSFDAKCPISTMNACVIVASIINVQEWSARALWVACPVEIISDVDLEILQVLSKVVITRFVPSIAIELLNYQNSVLKLRL